MKAHTKKPNHDIDFNWLHVYFSGVDLYTYATRELKAGFFAGLGQQQNNNKEQSNCNYV
jgi:hypothetical protein